MKTPLISREMLHEELYFIAAYCSAITLITTRDTMNSSNRALPIHGTPVLHCTDDITLTSNQEMLNTNTTYTNYCIIVYCDGANSSACCA